MMKKKHLLITLLSITLLTLSGCQAVENWFKNAKEEWLGLEMTVRTYDENFPAHRPNVGQVPYPSRVMRSLIQLMKKEIRKEDSSVLKITLGSMRLTM